MGRDPVRFAVLQPYASQWLLSQLTEAGRSVPAVRAQAAWLRGLSDPLAARLAADLEVGWAQLEASAADHRDRMRTRQFKTASVDGNAEGSSAKAGGGLVVTAGEMNTQEAAEMLRKTPRRVSQLLAQGALKGRKVGRSWLVDRESVELLRDVREAS